MKELGTEPAFPHETIEFNRDGGPVNMDLRTMSKRFYAACAAMQGVLANHYTSLNKKIIIQDALDFADEILKQETL